MRVFTKGLNSCAMRKQNLQHYNNFLMANGHEVVSSPADAESIILWTCAFREDVRDNSLEAIRRFSTEYRGDVIVTGCLPDISPEMLRAVFDGRVIPWRNDGPAMERLFGGKYSFESVPGVFVEDNFCTDVAQFRRENPEKDATFQDQFIKLVISEGCHYQCSYCSERLAFPPFRSFPEKELVEKCREAIYRTGHKEVILLADSLGDYGADRGGSLPELIGKLLEIDPAVRVALSNLNPDGFIRFQDDLVAFIRNGKIRHLNLPIQSASDRILKLMNRPYSRDQIEQVLESLHALRFSEFDTHLLIGFPGETDSDFEETVRFIVRRGPKYVLASGFMETDSMPASRLPDKVGAEERGARLRRLSERMRAEGIICNTDDSALIRDRFRRLNNQ